MRLPLLIAILLMVTLLFTFSCSSMPSSSTHTPSETQQINATPTTGEISTSTPIVSTTPIQVQPEISIVTDSRYNIDPISERWILHELSVQISSVSAMSYSDIAIVLSLEGNEISRNNLSDDGEVLLEGLTPGLYLIEAYESNIKLSEKQVKVEYQPQSVDSNILSQYSFKSDIPVVAAYYGWYDGSPTWRHWNDPTNPDTIYYPVLSEFVGTWEEQWYRLYNSSNELYEKQISLAKMSGISCFAVSWWGPGSFEDIGFGQLLSIAEELDFNVTIIFEPFYYGGSLEDERTKLETSIGYLQDNYLSSKAWLKDTSDDPVIFTFDTRNIDNIWEPVISDSSISWVGHSTDRSILDHGFQYLYEYSPVGILAAGDNIEEVYLGVSSPPYDDKLIPTVSPRYDDTKIRTSGGKIGSQLWEETWQATLKMIESRNPPFIFVTSWNEWHESTSIEPSYDSEFTFLNDLRTYLDKHPLDVAIWLSVLSVSIE